ncbi:hypothetical protein B0H13DRAFT_998252 [Mycena leptocephala]|nr:hypothetical protein B0H13DRAFT_998252 [Mycena leptocephala]
MANPETSPISQLLNSLGITREDLNRRSDQMRQFLTAESATSSRVSSQLPPRPQSPAHSLAQAAQLPLLRASFPVGVPFPHATRLLPLTPPPSSLNPRRSPFLPGPVSSTAWRWSSSASA